MVSQRFVFLNTTILTGDGDYRLETIPLDNVKRELAAHPEIPRLSAIGHASTAEILTELLGEPICVNRIEYAQTVYDITFCLKLKSRIPEGTIVTREEIEKIGYEFKLLTKWSTKDLDK